MDKTFVDFYQQMAQVVHEVVPDSGATGGTGYSKDGATQHIERRSDHANVTVSNPIQPGMQTPGEEKGSEAIVLTPKPGEVRRNGF
jgi:hypothetical protein